jgi:hypothetical protein
LSMPLAVQPARSKSSRDLQAASGMARSVQGRAAEVRRAALTVDGTTSGGSPPRAADPGAQRRVGIDRLFADGVGRGLFRHTRAPR